MALDLFSEGINQETIDNLSLDEIDSLLEMLQKAGY
jgi:hypothetical protein